MSRNFINFLIENMTNYSHQPSNAYLINNLVSSLFTTDICLEHRWYSGRNADALILLMKLYSEDTIFLNYSSLYSF